MEQEKFLCNGECTSCRRNKEPQEQRDQWMYCAAHRSYESMKVVETMQQSLATMIGTVEELKAKIEAIQNNEISIFNPSESPVSSDTIATNPITQEGSGVVE